MESLVIIVPGKMRGKGRPRFARCGKFAVAYTDEATANAETWVKHCAKEQVGNPCLSGPLRVWITIGVFIAPSWPKHKRAAAEAGTLMPVGKPDLDNTGKLVIDSLNQIVWGDDAQIVDLILSKRYTLAPETIIRVEHA